MATQTMEIKEQVDKVKKFLEVFNTFYNKRTSTIMSIEEIEARLSQDFEDEPTKDSPT